MFDRILFRLRGRSYWSEFEHLNAKKDVIRGERVNAGQSIHLSLSLDVECDVHGGSTEVTSDDLLAGCYLIKIL